MDIIDVIAYIEDMIIESKEEIQANGMIPEVFHVENSRIETCEDILTLLNQLKK